MQTMHRMNRERYAGDSKMHEMVAVAMEENWNVCQKHIDCLIGVTADVIGDGVASGEFHTPDIGGAALCVLTAMLRFFHPQFIAEFADKPTATLDQMIDFVITGLSFFLALSASAIRGNARFDFGGNVQRRLCAEILQLDCR
jgi:hypothetical protein